MPGKRATPEIRRNQLIAASEQILHEAGIKGFTVDKVVQRAEIAKGTLYTYYKNKDELLAEIVVKAMTLMHAHFETRIMQQSHSLAQIRALCIACFEYYQLYPRYFELISYMERPDFDIDMSGYLKLSKQLQSLVLGIVERGQAQEEIKSTYDASMVYYIIWAACVGVVEFVDTKKNLLKNHHEIDTKQMVETFADLLTEGMKA